ncbi:uncharacterized protein C8orf48 [Stegastes partitus]|uniref:Uncharacterized protein C8orf48 homolog n=1 Tax=Stegastes partitus TaxID=144197 RepID=A0A9Y4K9W7_9TELE|nr:PREDICTED: uncharacterized protein C8orf48 homolog [Stegastes partitus]XP_008285653.1 PREDICTED: uncharacterized protein C8orf48 homolog [Stegastes partitus]XP_008285655.1 PREDICTED: uncharacterized protein C8orf48 homolog [Stegastes partitus]
MNEDEAVSSFCRQTISRVRNKLLRSAEENRRRQSPRAAGGSDGTGSRDPSEPPPVPTEPSPVPLQLIAMLRIKTLKERMRRAAEVELHDPEACSACQQQQASLALKTFIRRKKTQLQFQTLTDRLNTHTGERLDTFEGSWCKKNLPKPTDAPHWIWEELLSEDMRVTAT